ncbi:MAG: hypothetical protein K8R91_01695 [Phycisphaerae bacterium]|nr:hypothetical protein [Phycisphaerae bacterium]
MVAMRQIEAVGREIGREFHPERVILFGSHAAEDSAWQRERDSDFPRRDTVPAYAAKC